MKKRTNPPKDNSIQKWAIVGLGMIFLGTIITAPMPTTFVSWCSVLAFPSITAIMVVLAQASGNKKGYKAAASDLTKEYFATFHPIQERFEAILEASGISKMYFKEGKNIRIFLSPESPKAGFFSRLKSKKQIGDLIANGAFSFRAEEVKQHLNCRVVYSQLVEGAKPFEDRVLQAGKTFEPTDKQEEIIKDGFILEAKKALNQLDAFSIKALMFSDKAYLTCLKGTICQSMVSLVAMLYPIVGDTANTANTVAFLRTVKEKTE